MQRRVSSPPLFFVIGLGILIWRGTLFFHLTTLTPWLTVGMAAFGLTLCIVSFALLMVGPRSSTARRQVVLYGAAIFLYGFANILLGIAAVFFGVTAAGTGLGLGAAVGGLLVCLLSGTFMAAGS